MADHSIHDSRQVLQELETTLRYLNTHLHHIEAYAAHLRTHSQQVIALGERSKALWAYLDDRWKTLQAVINAHP